MTVYKLPKGQLENLVRHIQELKKSVFDSQNVIRTAEQDLLYQQQIKQQFQEHLNALRLFLQRTDKPDINKDRLIDFGAHSCDYIARGK